MTTSIQELELQRCVDGELPPLERKALLERIETIDGGWKTLALAFLECQDFDAAGEEFRQAAPPASAAIAHNPAQSIGGRSSSLFQSVALAASLAMAFWVGRQGVRPAVNNPGQESSIASQTFAPGGSAASMTGSRAAMKPAAMLELPVQGEGREGLTIPVYDRQMLAEEGPPIPLWPDLNRKNSSAPAGYRLTSERNLISIPLETGETVVVPVEVSGVRYAVQ
jgi:hypothetical protein